MEQKIVLSLAGLTAGVFRWAAPLASLTSRNQTTRPHEMIERRTVYSDDPGNRDLWFQSSPAREGRCCAALANARGSLLDVSILTGP